MRDGQRRKRQPPLDQPQLWGIAVDILDPATMPDHEVILRIARLTLEGHLIWKRGDVAMQSGWVDDRVPAHLVQWLKDRGYCEAVEAN